MIELIHSPAKLRTEGGGAYHQEQNFETRVVLRRRPKGPVQLHLEHGSLLLWLVQPDTCTIVSCSSSKIRKSKP